MDFVNKAYAQLSELFRSMTPGTRIAAALLLGVIVVSLVYLFQYQGTSGDEYLLERRLLRRLSTGEEVSEHFGRFGFPYAYRFNVLRGLDYFRAASASKDPRMDEALQLIRERRGADGKWLLENSHEEEWVLDMGEGEGQPSRWVTLQAMRVLRHFNAE